MDLEKEEGASANAREEESKSCSLFPLLSDSDPKVSHSSSSQAEWLCNTSFSADLSLVNDAVSYHFDSQSESEEDDKDADPAPARVYQPLESDEDSDRIHKKKKKKKKRKRQRQSSPDRHGSALGLGFTRRSSGLRDDNKPYFFDSKGDPDNLVFASLYRYSHEKENYAID